MTLRKVLLNLSDEEKGDNIIELVPDLTVEFCEEIFNKSKEKEYYESFNELREVCEKENKDVNKVDDLFFRFMMHQIKTIFGRLIKWQESADIGTNYNVEEIAIIIDENRKKKIIEKRKEEETVQSEIDNNASEIQIDQLLPPFLLMFNTINTEIPNINRRWALELGEDLVAGGPTRQSTSDCYLIHNWQNDKWLSWYDDLRAHRVLTKRAVKNMRRFFPTFQSLLSHLDSSVEKEGAVNDKTRVLRLNTFKDFEDNKGDVEPYFVYYFAMMMMINIVFREVVEVVEKGDLIERLWQTGRIEFASTVIRRSILINTVGSYRLAYLLNKLNAIGMYFTLALSIGKEGLTTMTEINDKVCHSVGDWKDFSTNKYFKDRFEESVTMLALRTIKKNSTAQNGNYYVNLKLTTFESQFNYERENAVNLLSQTQDRPNNYNQWPPLIQNDSKYFNLMFNSVFPPLPDYLPKTDDVVVSFAMIYYKFRDVWSRGYLETTVTKEDFVDDKQRLYLLELAYLNTLINNKRKTSDALVYPLESPLPNDVFKKSYGGWSRLTEMNMIVDKMSELFEDRANISSFDDIKGRIECQREEVCVRIVCPSVDSFDGVVKVNKKTAAHLENKDLIKIVKALDGHQLLNNRARSEKLHNRLSSVIVRKMIVDDEDDVDDDGGDLCLLMGIDEDTDDDLLDFYLRFCLIDVIIAYLIGEKEEEETMLKNTFPYKIDSDDNFTVFTARTVFESFVGIYI